MMRSDIVRSAGGYHKAFRHCEDFDLWLRLASQTKICSLPDILLYYRHSPDQISRKYSVEQVIGVAISEMAYAHRMDGRPDPTQNIDILPPLDQLNSIFGRDDALYKVQTYLTRLARFSPHIIEGDVRDQIMDFIQQGGHVTKIWRIVYALFNDGRPKDALNFAIALLNRPKRTPKSARPREKNGTKKGMS